MGEEERDVAAAIAESLAVAPTPAPALAPGRTGRFDALSVASASSPRSSASSSLSDWALSSRGGDSTMPQPDCRRASTETVPTRGPPSAMPSGDSVSSYRTAPSMSGQSSAFGSRPGPRVKALPRLEDGPAINVRFVQIKELVSEVLSIKAPVSDTRAFFVEAALQLELTNTAKLSLNGLSLVVAEAVYGDLTKAPTPGGRFQTPSHAVNGLRDALASRARTLP